MMKMILIILIKMEVTV